MRDENVRQVVADWLTGFSTEARQTLYALLDEVSAGFDVSRHSRFGFLRLRAEFESSGELLGCSIADLRDAVGATLSSEKLPPATPRSALDALRAEIGRRGHPDFR